MAGSRLVWDVVAGDKRLRREERDQRVLSLVLWFFVCTKLQLVRSLIVFSSSLSARVTIVQTSLRVKQ
jgi:hypothetical protein